jgi:excisionase family DNA binding protein
MNEEVLPKSVTGRRAVVYVRQSTAFQVAENLESQRRQYELVERARELGFREVEIVDDDLGRSASGAVDRPGFERMVGWLCAGIVGAVFCLEASRLARNGHDWHRLLELCGLVNARVIDADGVYDPCHPNDRLLLGMKGTISEFEQGILRARLNEARNAKAARGELRIAVPIGFVWDRDGRVTLDPDLRVQEVVRLVFSKFRQLGSARQVTLWMRREKVHFPRPSDGKKCTSFNWRLTRYRSVISVLKNPFYAGVYAYGKSQVRTDVVEGRPRRSYGHQKAREEWSVFIRDHHEGYLDWDEYERNQAQLDRNNFAKSGGAKSGRGGRSLLSGLMRCRRCGRRASVQYGGRSYVQYRCMSQITDGRGPMCWCFAGWAADQAIAVELFRAVQPLAVEAGMEAERQREHEREEEIRVHELELEQARYDAQLAERRYASCDPDNRLVASQLEERWEQAMRRVRACEDKVTAHKAVPSVDAPHADLRGLASDLEAAWSAPGVTMRTRQRLVRAVIEEIVADVDEEAGEVVLLVHWKGGQHSEVRVRKPRTGEHRRRASEEAIDVVRAMAGKWPDDQIAATLNRMGFRTGQDMTWNARRVRATRHTHDIRAYKSAKPGSDWLTMSAAATRLGVSHHQIRRLINEGTLAAEQVMKGAPYQIRAQDLESEAVQEALALRGRPCRVDAATQEPLFIDVSGGHAQ